MRREENMTQRSRILAAFGALVVIGATLVGVSVANDQSKQKSNSTSQTTQKKEEPLKVSYAGQDGKTALELLKSSYNVETKSYEGLGEMVTSINGVVPDSKHFWALYIGDAQSQVGADTYVTKNGEAITWKLEAIQ